MSTVPVPNHPACRPAQRIDGCPMRSPHPAHRAPRRRTPRPATITSIITGCALAALSFAAALAQTGTCQPGRGGDDCDGRASADRQAPADRPRALGRRRARHHAYRRAEGAGRAAHSRRLRRGHVDGLDRRRPLRERQCRRRKCRRSSPRSTGRRCSPIRHRGASFRFATRSATRDFRCRSKSDSAMARSAGSRARCRAATSRSSCTTSRARPTVCAISTGCRFPFARSPPTWSPERLTCSSRARCTRRCAPACRSPACFRRRTFAATSWAMAASSTTCRSTSCARWAPKS